MSLTNFLEFTLGRIRTPSYLSLPASHVMWETQQIPTTTRLARSSHHSVPHNWGAMSQISPPAYDPHVFDFAIVWWVDQSGPLHFRSRNVDHSSGLHHGHGPPDERLLSHIGRDSVSTYPKKQKKVVYLPDMGWAKWMMPRCSNSGLSKREAIPCWRDNCTESLSCGAHF